MDGQYLSSASAAKRLGVSAKTLRLYEERGLVLPLRTQAGWRMYGPVEMARLHQILALKDLRLSLSDIAKVMAGDADKLDFVLDLQERALAKEVARLSHGLALVRAARRKRAGGLTLSVEDLVELTRETAFLAPLWEKHFTSAELNELMARAELNSEAFAATQERLLADIKLLAAEGTADSPEALELGRRWLAQCDIITRGDDRMREKFAAITADALADPDVAASLPIGPELYEFLGRILRHLARTTGKSPKTADGEKNGCV